MSDNKEQPEESVLDAFDKMEQQLEEYNNKARTVRNDSQGE